MTTAFDTEMAAVATELVDELGTTITYTVKTGSTYDPATSSTSAGTSTPYAVKSSPPFEFDLKYVDGDLIQTGDLMVILPSANAAGTALPFAAALIAETRDITAPLNGRTYRVLDVTPYRTGDDIAAYQLHMRQGPA